MNTTELHTFIKVYELCSISAAAKSLHITQPAVSKRIQNLEAEFDTVLFDAVGRGIKPTAAAKELLGFAKRWLLDYDNARHELGARRDTVAGKLTIGTSHHIGLHHLAPVLRSFLASYPEVELDVHFVNSETAHDQVLAGDLSFAFITLPPAGIVEKNPKLEYMDVWHDELLFVAGSESALSKQKGLTLEALAKQPAILPAEHTFTCQVALSAFAKLGLKPKATMSTSPLESIRLLVGIGLGWSLLPRSLVGAELTQLTLKNDPKLSRTLGVVLNPARTQSAAARALLGLVGQ